MNSETTSFRMIEIQENPDEYMAVIKERIRKIGSFSLLGPPDLLHITRCRTKTQFLSKPKKELKSSYVFLAGLNMQNIAYLNSYVTRLLNSQKKQKSSGGDVQKAYFCVFDCFRRIDLHIQISIPGSTSVLAFDRNEKKLVATEQMYAQAYFSSTLRSMQIKHFPFLKIYDEISNRRFLNNFISAFVPFAVSNLIDGTRDVNPISVKGNMGLWLLFRYLTEREANVVIKEALEVLKTRSENLAQLFRCEIEFSRENYRKVVKSAASVLVTNPTSPAFLYIQARALLQCRRYNEAIKISRSIVFQGQASHEVWVLLAKAYFYIKDYRTLFVLMNTALNLVEEPPEYLNPASRQMAKLEIPSAMLVSESFNVLKPTTIRESSVLIDYYFKFDNWFLDKFGKIKSLVESLKRLKKETQMATLIEKSDRALKRPNSFYKILVMIEREKNWEYLINLRNRVFWLESDFENITQLICDSLQETTSENGQYANFQPGHDINEKSFVLLNNENQKSENNSPTRKRSFISKTEELVDNRDREKELPRLVTEDEDRVEQKVSRQEKSFELDPSKLSETELGHHQAAIRQPEPISSRVRNLVLESKQMLLNELYQQKVLCNTALEKLFTDIYEDLVLQLEFEGWMKQLPPATSVSNEKSQIISIVLLKKAFLNKKLMRYRKVEQTVKLGLTYAKRNLTKIVSVFTLTEIYIETRNFRGAQLYLEELLNLLSEVGLKQYDVIPQWMQEIVLPIMANIGSSEKIRIVMDRWKQGPLLASFEACFRMFKTQQ